MAQRDLIALEARYAGWRAQLDAAGIAPSLDHGDLHDGNVFVRAAATQASTGVTPA